jgi:hypothetical protein
MLGRPALRGDVFLGLPHPRAVACGGSMRPAYRGWRSSSVAASLAVGAAVSAGLAVSALLHRSAPPGAVDVGERLGLPGCYWHR